MITTNISTITIDDKENRDPVTGLPLSSLLGNGKGAKGKGKGSSTAVANPFSSGQKFIATTITTTVLSPVPVTFVASAPASDDPLMSPTPAAKSQSRKARVALGGVTQSNSNIGREGPTSKPAKRLASVTGPRRSLRLAEIAENVIPEIPSTPTTAKSTRAKAPKASSKGKTLRAASTSTTSAAGAAGPPQAKAKKLALARHSAAVAAAADGVMSNADIAVMPSGSNKKALASAVVEGDSLVVMHVSPVKKRTSPRRGGILAEEVFLNGQAPNPLRTAPSYVNIFNEPTRSLSFVDNDAMDLDVEFVEPNEAQETAACLQRIIDQRCRELSVIPLGDISGAFMQTENLAQS